MLVCQLWVESVEVEQIVKCQITPNASVSTEYGRGRERLAMWRAPSCGSRAASTANGPRHRCESAGDYGDARHSSMTDVIDCSRRSDAVQDLMAIRLQLQEEAGAAQHASAQLATKGVASLGAG